MVADVRDHGVQGGFEGIGGVLGLGEEQSALHGGEQCEGKLARVGPRRQGAVAGHGGQAGADRLGPGGEAGGQGVAGPRVVVGQFAAQAAQRAAAGAVLLPGGVDHDVAPCTERVEAVKPGQERCMEGQVGVGLERDDRPGEVVLVGEVVVDLRGADAGGVADRRGAGACHSVTVHEIRRGRDDPVSRRAAFPRARRVLLRHLITCPLEWI